MLYINKYFEVNLTTSTNTSYYYPVSSTGQAMGGALIAMSVNSTLRYIQQDHLTGTSVMTSASGDWLGTIKYTPFGETRSVAGELYTDKLFTGQILDDTGLYFYNARYYDPMIGRFISPDTIIPNLANPQCFNRYSYCLNNPLKYIDPTGYQEGTVEINGVEYEIVDDGNGNYHLEDPNGGVSGSVDYATLIEMIGSEMEYYGEYGYGGNEEIGAVVTVNVETNLGLTVPVHYVPEGFITWYDWRNERNGIFDPYTIAASALGNLNVPGISLDFTGGAYVRYQRYQTSELLSEATMHECEHYWEQSRPNGGGFFWYSSYISEWLWNKNHDTRTAETRAIGYEKSLDPNISPPSTWENIKATVTNLINWIR